MPGSILSSFLNSSKDINDIKKFRTSVGVKFVSEQKIHLDPEIFGEKCQQGVLLGCTEHIAFGYFSTKYEGGKVTKKSIKHLLNTSLSGTLGSQLRDKQYLILSFHANHAEILIGIDIHNKQHPKITTTIIDTAGYTDADGIQRYKNRTIEEQFTQLKEDLGGGERTLSLRFIKKFFQKDKLTENFYFIYKTKLFDHIKKDLKTKYTGQTEDIINNFILINLNRLLFIHFLDKKGGFFPQYDKKRGSYISYLFHEVYRESKSDQSCYEVLLKPLFFEVFAKPQSQRKFSHISYLQKNFFELPYLNGGLFKESIEEQQSNMIIDNLFIKTFITEIIDQFNFTITEDTPLDVSVAVDPELLGYIFENLIQEYDNEQMSKNKEKKSSKKDNQRSSGGIFYTPKIEVDFMCRQSLVEWLAKDPLLSDRKKDLYELFYPEQGGSDEQKSGSFSLTQIHKIFTMLESVSVVDPACGSGAFLVGMMQVILDVENTLLDANIEKIKAGGDEQLKEYLRKKFDTFNRKKQLIRHSLHGVDIKAWAVEIAKLRLWLSMIVDAEQSSFEGARAKTDPLLPSFAFKIIQGDSLINRIGYGLIPLDLRRTGEISAAAKTKIQEVAKLKQQFYDNIIKDEQQVWKEEFAVFEKIMLDRVRYLKGERTKIVDTLNLSDNEGLFDNKQKKLTDTVRRKYEKVKSDLSSQIETLESQITQLTLKQRSPFARAIAFSDIMLEKRGFDILVGNPPYVRQEEIGDPTGQIKDKKIYKDLCQHDLISQDRNQEIERVARIKGGIAVGGRSDLYLYFYFRGLALINERGIFSFITSNSFLDVDFGASLQEFLIRFCPRIKVIDNAVQRSFASASINTVMVFLDKPIISTEMFGGSAQFINFSKEYDQVLRSETLAELDPEVYIRPEMIEKIITTGDISFVKRSNDLLRVIDISAIDLRRDGGEDDVYTGNKRGGKYLRAPEIFFTVLEKGGNKISKLGDILKLTQRNTLQDFESITKIITTDKYIGNETIPYLSSSKQSESIIPETNRNYIVLDKSCYKKEFITIQSPDIISNRFIGERIFFMKGGSFFVGDTFFVGFMKDGVDKDTTINSINSTLGIFFVEMIGRKNMGDGVLLFYGPEFNQLPYFNKGFEYKEKNFLKRKVQPIFTEIGFDKTKDIRSQIPSPLPDRKELDDIIFDELDLTQDERNEVYRSLAELVKARLDKAKSV